VVDLGGYGKEKRVFFKRIGTQVGWMSRVCFVLLRAMWLAMLNVDVLFDSSLLFQPSALLYILPYVFQLGPIECYLFLQCVS
jgi:hypothetical protein